jgi:uncharacterized membrane protein YfhO
VIHTASNTPGLLIVSEAYYPGWAADANHVSVPVIQADGYLQVVPIPAGSAVVQLNYRPPALMWGALISVFAFVLGIGLVIAGHYHIFDRVIKRHD